VPDAQVLVVDDASPDGTARSSSAPQPNMAGPGRAAAPPGKSGLGTAYRDGFAWGMGRGHEVLVQMDADFQHDPAALPELLAALQDGADAVIGSRYVPGGSVPAAWPWHRKLLSRGANLYARTVLRLPVRDVTAGFRVHRRSVLDRLDLGSIGADGYGFQIGLTHRTVLAGATITEVPIQFGERTSGTSKMSLKIMVEAFWLVASDRGSTPPFKPLSTEGSRRSVAPHRKTTGDPVRMGSVPTPRARRPVGRSGASAYPVNVPRVIAEATRSEKARAYVRRRCDVSARPTNSTPISRTAL
jgi:dolichol-phosphate mannosyltransferase